MKEETINTDVLCVGGGIAGLMAAIRAREMGARVIVAEKGHARFSGRGRSGNDHFWCYIPEIHGQDVDSFLRECLKGPKLKLIQSGTSIHVLRTFLENSFDIVKLWDRWGIPMKYHGRWEFAGHAFPGHVLNHLKYEGKHQKRILFDKAVEKGAEIINRVMVFDLLSDGDSVFGAIGIHTREKKFIIFKAKSVILGTGLVDRLYPPVIPAWMGSSPFCMTVTGDGRAMTYRAGGTIVGPEIPKRHMGPRYFARAGQATWIGVLRDPGDKPIGPYVTKPERIYGDMTMEVSSTILEDYLKSGRGPTYMDCRGISTADLDYMTHWLEHEGNSVLLNHMKEEGIDLRKHPIEFGTYQILPEGKITINEKSETSLKGLYAAGDEAMLSIGPASTYGWIAGERAAAYAQEAEIWDENRFRSLIEKKKSQIHEIESRKQGPDWREANIALQHIMKDYAGVVRSETLLESGLSYLERLEKKVLDNILAKNRWELTRCLEVLNLLEMGKLVFLAASARKETRGLHKRVDYPLTDPMLNGKSLFIRMVDGQPHTEWQTTES